MKPKRRSYVRKVTALIDADATFLSVVNRGANGSPFNSVKHEEPKNMKVKSRRGVPAPKKTAKNASKRVSGETKKKTEGSNELPLDRAIEKLVFDKSIYETEDDVRQYIEEESDFEGNIEIVDEGETFIVKNADLDPVQIKKSAEVDTGEEGVVAWVALLKTSEDVSDASDDEDEEEEDDDSSITKSEDEEVEDDAAAEDDDTITLSEDEDDEEEEADEDDKKKPVSKREAFLETLQKEAEPKAPIKKFEHWNVYESGDSDFATLLKAGMEDGAAPRFEDVMWTFGQAVKKALKTGGDNMSDTLQKSASDFVTVTVRMNDLFSNMVECEKAEIEEELGDEAEAFTKWAKEFGLSIIRDDNTAAPAKVAKSENVAPAALDPEVLAKAVADAIAPLVAAHKEVQAKMDTVVETVDILGKRRQVSKAISTPDASVSEGSTPTDTTTKKKADPGKTSADRIAKVAFGG